MLELILNFKSSKVKPKYVRLYKYIRDEIESKRIGPNEKIPSIRLVAKQLGISRTTVENAYYQLTLEGYIYSRSKSGYYACDIGTIPSNKNMDIKTVNEDFQVFDKNTGEYLDEGCFSFAAWKKSYNRVLLYQSKKLIQHGSPQGEIELRQELSKYVYRSRGVKCTFDQIIIGAGVQVLLGILCTLLKTLNISGIAFEDPGFTDVWHVFEDYGFNLLPVSVSERGLNVKELAESSAQICYVSPSHQFPTGTIMPVGNRLDLLKWSKDNNSYIIEDDYDSELRYSGNPIPSLQSLDMYGRVVYLGSFSTVFLPSVRISYMILPGILLKQYKKFGIRYNQTSSKIEQLTLASYINEGEFERHLRRIRKKFAVKYALLKNSIEKLCAQRIKILPSDSGTNMIMLLKDTKNVSAAAKSMCSKGLTVKHISDSMLLLKFTTIPEKKIAAAAQIINGCI